MPAYYFDSSAIVKYYVEEPGSAWVAAMLAHEDVPAFISPIAGVEVLATFTRKGRRGELGSEAQEAAVRKFQGDFITRFTHGLLDLRTLQRAMDLVCQHPLRAYDALQLATSLLLASALPPDFPPLTFVSADSSLNQLAERLGLSAENPNSYP